MLFLTLVLAGGFLELAGDTGRALLRYERSSIESLELWRLVTGHFVHLGWTHYLLNAAGLILTAFLVGKAFRPGEWLTVVFFAIASIDLGFWLFEPALERYVGLSGVLHGLLAGGLLAGFRHRRTESTVLGVLLALKLAWEQFVGALPGSTTATGATVVVDAHLYGAVGGLVAAMLLLRVRRSASV